VYQNGIAENAGINLNLDLMETDASQQPMDLGNWPAQSNDLSTNN
jgi:hypothetical protein